MANENAPVNKEPFRPKRKKSKNKIFRPESLKWAVTVVVWTFVISIAFSFASNKALEKASLPLAFVILLIFIVLGILFDVFGLATATASEKPFHSMAARRVPGSQEALWLLRRADRVSSFCNDVVGDICGIISGATSAAIAVMIISAQGQGENVLPSLIVSGVVAALTIGGKAFCKGVAMGYNVQIVHGIGRVLHVFSLFGKRKKKK